MIGKNSILQQSSELLADNRDLYRLLVQGVNDYAIFLLSPKGHVQTWNQGAQKIKGYLPEEIIGEHFSKFYPREAAESGYPDMELEMATKYGRFEDEGWRIKKDGSTFWANVIITAIYDIHKKEVIGFSKITRDLTERKMLEERLKKALEELNKSEERARLLIEGVKDYAIFMLTPEGRIATWNRGAEHIKGYTANEIIGKHFSIFYTEDAIQRRYPEYELSRAIADGRFEDEGWRLRKDGESIWVNVVITPVYTADKKHIGFTKVTRDLSEKKKNEELMHKNRELHKINTDLDNFIYTASHDLKAPIANLEGLVAVLKQDLGPDIAKHEEVVNRIDNSITRLNNIIIDLTDVSRIQYEDSLVESVNIEQMLEEVKGSLENLIISYNAVIEADLSGFSEISYSTKNFRSILFNLISNAIKYSSPDRQPLIRIKTEKLQDEGQYLLTVSDNGLGIDKKHKYKIFSMFKRMHTHVEGTGLGLYLVKRILENSDDRIEVESEVGKGSTFKLYFHQNEAS